MKLPFHDRKFILLLLAVAIAVILEIFSILEIEIPYQYAPIIYGIFILGIGYQVLWDGLKSLAKLNFASIHLLMLIAVCAAFYLGEYPEATVVIVLYVLGEKLEDIGIENSMSALDNLVKNVPKTAILKSSGQTEPVNNIPVGSIIQVKPHDLIPLDGLIVTGETAVDEASITGEPIPCDKSAGDTVFAGTLNKYGFIEVKTTKPANDTTFAKIIELTFEAQNNKSDAQKFIQKFATYYTPFVIILAILLFVIPVFILHGELNHWLKQAVTLLVISCPCALVISTPVAIYAAIGNASSKGILIKGGKYLEYMAEIKAVGLDKTRTITYGKPIVSDIIPLNGSDIAELLACGAGTEIFSEHPLAQAIVDASRKEGFEPHEADTFESVAGKGARSKCLVCGNEAVLVGKLNFVKEHHAVSTEVEHIVEKLSKEGKTSVVVSCNNEIRGVIGLTDEIKPDSFEAIKELHALHIEPVMMTGDSDYAARFVANSVGITQIFSELLPEAKSKCIQTLTSQYKNVAMVGDGINDAPALAQATVGIAMGAAGSDAAIEVSNIALMNDKISLIPYLVRLGKKTVRTIRNNCIGAIIVKIFFIALALAGHGNLVFAIAADVGVTLIVVLISLRLMKFR